MDTLEAIAQALLRTALVVAATLALPNAFADGRFAPSQYSAGGTVQTTGPVQGSFYALGGKVIVDQPVGGDAALMAGQVKVRAAIGGSLRAAGGDVDIDAPVGGTLSAAGGNVRLGAGARIGGDVSLAGGTLDIDGQIDGDMVARAQHIVLDGRIDGNARLLAERIELGPSARITGTLRRTSRSFTMADSARIGRIVDSGNDDEAMPRSRRDHDDMGQWQWQRRFSVASWVGMTLGLLGLLAVGAVYLLLMPRFAAEAPRQIRHSPWLSLAIGFVTVLCVPLLGALLCITLLGLPLGFALFALYPLLLLTGYLTGALFIGQTLRAALRPARAPGLGASLLMLALALALLIALSWLPVIGHLVWLLTLLAGVGACTLEWQRRRRSPMP